MRFRVPFHRALQAFAALTLAAVAVTVPATVAHANDPGAKLPLITYDNVGIYTQPQVGAKNPAAIDLAHSSSAVYATCYVDGQKVGNGTDLWYEISGEQTGGFNHSWAGWVYADYVDYADAVKDSVLPYCGTLVDHANSVPIRATAGHNLGLYSCPAASSGYCLGKKNGPDLAMGSTVYVQCYQYGENVLGLGSLWFDISGESSGAHYGGWVLGSYLDNSVIPSGLRHCTSLDYTY